MTSLDLSKNTLYRRDFDRLANNKTTVSGTLNLDELFSIINLTNQEINGSIFVSILFSHNEKHNFNTNSLLIEGGFEAKFSMQCQRCLDSIDHNLITKSFKLIGTRSEDLVNSFEDSFETILLQEYNIAKLIADEFFLNLPTVSYHENMQDCSISAKYFVNSDESRNKLAIFNQESFSNLANHK